MNKKSTIAVLQKEGSKTEALLTSCRTQSTFLNEYLAPQLVTLLEGKARVIQAK